MAENRYTHIIWDFNGTLFDDIGACMTSVNKMLEDRGLPQLQSEEEYRNVFGFPIIDYYRKLGFDFDAEPYEVLAPIWVELYNKNSEDSKLQRDAINALEYFKNLEIPQILLSATELNMLKAQIEKLEIDKYFDSVMGLDNIHAYSKKELALTWKAKHPDANPLFIGDTEHDAAVAEAFGADCILICNGHQSRATLENCKGCVVCKDLFHMGMVFEIRNFR